MSFWRISSFYYYGMPLFILDAFPFSAVFFVRNYNSYSSYPLISVNMIFLCPLTYLSLYIYCGFLVENVVKSYFFNQIWKSLNQCRDFTFTVIIDLVELIFYPVDNVFYSLHRLVVSFFSSFLVVSCFNWGFYLSPFYLLFQHFNYTYIVTAFPMFYNT